MRLPDIWTGLIAAVFGVAIFLQAQGFAEPAGAASPRLFPGIIGVAFVLFGGLIAGRAWLRAGARLSIARPAWPGDWRLAGRLAFVPLAIIAFLLVAPALGSVVTGIAIVAGFALLWGERPLVAGGYAVVFVAVLWLFFTRVMNVPLPMGPLAGLM